MGYAISEARGLTYRKVHQSDPWVGRSRDGVVPFAEPSSPSPVLYIPNKKYFTDGGEDFGMLIDKVVVVACVLATG